MNTRRSSAVLVFALLVSSPVLAQVEGFKLSKINGGVGIEPAPASDFGHALVFLGDLDGNGVGDLAVGEPGRDDGGTDRGAVWILFRRADGTVVGSVSLDSTPGSFPGSLADHARFGAALVAPGDLNGDGTPDLYVGAPSNGLAGRGAVWAVHLGTDGTALGAVEIGEGTGGLGSGAQGALDGFTHFGTSLALVGDLDGDGRDELAAGSPPWRRVWILFPSLGGGGAVGGWQRIGPALGGAPVEGGYPGTSVRDFASSLAGPGDLDGNGVPELVVGSPHENTTNPFQTTDDGRLEVLFLTAVGTVQSRVEIAAVEVFPDVDPEVLLFGSTLARLDDPDQDGRFDLGVGRWPAGVLARLSLGVDGSVTTSSVVGLGEPGFDLGILEDDRFGFALAALDDQNGDGLSGYAVGAPRDDDGGTGRGAVWILNEGSGDGVPNRDLGSVLEERRIGINTPTGGFGGTFDESQGLFGDHRVAALGDVDGDGTEDLAWGIPYDSTTGVNRGAVYVVFLNPDGTVREETRIDDQVGGLVRDLGDGSRLGRSLAAAGDRDGNGVPDLLVGAVDWMASPDRAGFFVLYLASDGTVLAERWIADGESGFAGGAQTHDSFAASLTVVGDLNGDGHDEWAAGAPEALSAAGQAFVLFTAADESILGSTLLQLGQDGLPAGFSGTEFGKGLASLADLNGDGRRELAVGVPDYSVDVGGTVYSGGGVFVLFPGTDGVPTSFVLLGASEGLDLPASFDGDLGAALTTVDDLDRDGFEELCAFGKSSVYLLDLRPQAAVESIGRYFFGTNGVVDVESFETTVASLDYDGDGTPDLAVIDKKGFFDSIELLRLQGPQFRAESFGCPGTPAGSLAVVSGDGRIGESLVLAVDNPLGTQTGPAVPILIFGSAPLDCGTLSIPGWGMGAPGAPGDVLIQALVPLFYRLGPLWTDSGPSQITLAIPHDSALVGGSVALQAILWDPVASLGIEFALTEGVELEIGTPPPSPAQ